MNVQDGQKFMATFARAPQAFIDSYRHFYANFKLFPSAVSNPNAAVARHTLEWLIAAVREELGETSAGQACGALSSDLLELYSGFGANTVAL
eukprot:SAG11_NODE_3176_length_2631_cov_1.661532_2_plen_92_part_00